MVFTAICTMIMKVLQFLKLPPYKPFPKHPLNVTILGRDNNSSDFRQRIALERCYIKNNQSLLKNQLNSTVTQYIALMKEHDSDLKSCLKW